MTPTKSNQRSEVKKIIELIKKGLLIKAASLLVEICPQNDRISYRKAILIAMEANVLEQGFIGGQVAWEQAKQERNRLVSRMLQLMENLEPLEGIGSQQEVS